MNHTRSAAIVFAAMASLLLAGCSSSPAPAKTTGAASPGTGTATADASTTDAAGAFKAIAAGVETAKLSGTVTADNDPNHLLGRSGQYTSKVTFTDSRIKASDTDGLKPGDVELGGAVETFTSSADAGARAKYIQAVTKSIPALTEYDYVHGALVVRVSRFLTPAQASTYKAAADKLP
ncbi:hypothetical protein ACFYOD_19360 [Streptomyces sp. NPDC006703]|uniref:hypothetical protein n=1 Tax=Streptomyces sp. NPDC006703 TaxID=3364759 RepID=UPI00367B5337